MPTISESPWPDLKDKKQLILDQYINATPHSVDDSEDVLRARLFGLGYRLKSSVDTEVNLANMAKQLKRKVMVQHHTIMVMERGREPELFRFRNEHCATFVIEMLRGRRNVMFAGKVVG